MAGRTRIGIFGTVLAISASLGQAMTAGPVAASSTCTWWGNPQPLPVGASSGLSDVAVLSRCNAWVVGSSSSGHALLEHWNGQQWSVKKDPFVGSISDTLAALVMTSASNGWAVGHAGETVGDSNTLIERRYSSHWAVQTSPSPGTAYTWLQGVDASSSTNAWAVGVEANSSPHGLKYKSIVEHWNGSHWRVQSEGVVSGTGAIATLGSKDVWVAGGSIIQHWDGASWRNQHAPAPPVGVTYVLSDLMARSQKDVWAVGWRMKTSVASHRTLIEHWNGRRWRIVKSPNAGKRGNALYSVVATSGSNAWAAGISGWSDNSSIPTATLVERWNGTAWHVQPSADLGTGSNSLSGVDASSSTNAWAVGNYSTAQSGGEVRPLALHCC